MTRSSFKSVRDLVVSWAGQLITDLSAGQVAQVDGFINARLRDWAWPAWWWPEVCPAELRLYRLPYAAGTAYAAPTASSASEVFFPPTQQYYQALRATTGNAPATLGNGTYTTNGTYWAVCAGPYSGPDWLPNVAYSVGTIARNPADGRDYQCFSAHTSGSTIDTTQFGILTVFDPYVSRTQTGQTVIGDFLGMYLDDPHVWPNPRSVDFELDATGAHVQTSPRGRRWQRGVVTEIVPQQIWVRFRLKCPVFKGAVFDPAATYGAGVDTVYFAGTTSDLEGDYWSCAVNTTAGQSPQTTPASWTRLEFPAWLQTCVARRALADWLRAGAQRKEAALEDAAADDALFLAQIQQGAMQGQTLRWRQSA